MASISKILLTALSSAALASTAAAAVRVDFEGLTQNVGGLRADVAISDFYAGGSSKVPGTATSVTPGPSVALGVVFDGASLVTESTAVGGETSVFGLTRNLLLGDGSTIANSAALGTGVAYSGTADSMTLLFGAGFNDGLSFFFNSTADLTVSLLALNGSTLVSEDFTFSGTTLCPIAQSACQWNAASLDFVGTAFGVRFSGAAGGFALDNITLGSLDPFGDLPVVPDPGGPVHPIPEPSTYAMMILGLGLVAWAARRRRAPAVTAVTAVPA
ncbi:MAG: PEPxxWA-CTERM sorting domain-containing protein [Rubrivivax sp.]|nr:PEPxxWA-CTERM sorting domain-containing protein [Rubrivivax sp.]